MSAVVDSSIEIEMFAVLYAVLSIESDFTLVADLFLQFYTAFVQFKSYEISGH